MMYRNALITALIFNRIHGFHIKTSSPRLNIKHLNASVGPWTYSDLIHNIDQNSIERIILPYQGNILDVTDNDGYKHIVAVPSLSDNLLNNMISHNIDVSIVTAPIQNNLSVFFSSVLNLLPIFLIFFLPTILRAFMQNLSGGGDGGFSPMLPGGGMMGGNSKIVPVISNTTFDDIAGYEETKLELTEVVDILCNRNGENNTYDEIGARVPKGVIMEGPPGTGKTLMARAVAGEAGASFFSASGSEFVQMFVGLGASRVRDLFRLARENAPAIVFIDEIDAIGRQRESNGGVRGGNDEREQTLNQILTEIDGFNSKDGPNVIVIAATNRIDILDPALIRAGRFDRKVRVPLPDKNSRRKILELELTKKNIDTSLDLDLLSGITAGSSGSDINVLINEAALLGARKGLTSIDMKLIQSAFEKMQIGIPVALDSRSDETKRLIAVHESGHAIVGQYLHTHPNVTKITIAATTNGAGGYTVFGSPDDSPIPSRKTIVERLATMLGGRAAELFIYGEDDTTIGASMDLEQATSLARQSVGNYGLGGFLETQSMQTINFESDWKREQVDRTVRDLINEAFQLANQTISNNPDILDRLVEDLIQQTTIDSFAL